MEGARSTIGLRRIHRQNRRDPRSRRPLTDTTGAPQATAHAVRCIQSLVFRSDAPSASASSRANSQSFTHCRRQRSPVRCDGTSLFVRPLAKHYRFAALHLRKSLISELHVVRRLPLSSDRADAARHVDPAVAHRVRDAHPLETRGHVRCAARNEQLPSSSAPRFAPQRFSRPH
jgi:hypothetical protein